MQQLSFLTHLHEVVFPVLGSILVARGSHVLVGEKVIVSMVLLPLLLLPLLGLSLFFFFLRRK
jgi:hypothetical protein